LFALAAIAACILVDARMLRIGLDELDEGYFVEQAARVLHGALPYRDFDSLYTPGLLYFYTLIFTASGGPTLIGMRLATLAVRALTGVVLYVIGRSVLPWYWAVCPPLLLLIGLDTIPIGWEPHPAWYATLGAVLVAWLVARVPRASADARWIWMTLAGAGVALTYLFKQNAGILIGLAVVAVVVLEGFDPQDNCVNRPLRLLQVGIAGSIVCLVTWLVHQFLDGAVVLLVVSPVVLAMSFLFAGAHVDSAGGGARQRLVPLVPFALGGLAVTLPWLAALLVGLGGHLEHLGAFVGNIDQSLLYSPLEVPGPQALLAGAMGAVIVLGARARVPWQVIGIAIVATGVAVVATLSTRLADEPTLASVLLAPERVGDGFISLLPALAAWCGWIVGHRPGSPRDWRLRWYLTIGSLLLVTQYPRMDTIHLAWSAPLLLVVGVVVMARAHTWLSRHWQAGRPRAVLVAAGFGFVLLLAALPGLYDRASVFYTTNPDTGWPERTGLLSMDGPPLIAGFRLDAAAGYQLRDVLSYLNGQTSPNEPIFVYPSSPLLYVLADRPNPTRYSHVYPGMSTADQQALTETLDAVGVQTVVVSDAWLDFWGSVDNDPVITTYLDATFQEQARFGVFRVLTRRGSQAVQ
jgi:hypothetical protein